MSFDEDANSKATNHQNFRGGRVNALARKRDLSDYIERDMRSVIPDVVRNSGETAKVIALFADATPRTVENWQDGQCLPSAPKLIMLARQIPALKAKVLEWLDAENHELDRDPAEVLNEIQRLLWAKDRTK